MQVVVTKAPSEQAGFAAFAILVGAEHCHCVVVVVMAEGSTVSFVTLERLTELTGVLILVVVRASKVSLVMLAADSWAR